jgi:hypothetical protein
MGLARPRLVKTRDLRVEFICLRLKSDIVIKVSREWDLNP